MGTQFVLPSLVQKRSKSDLTAAREAEFGKWLGIYQDKMLSQGQYLGHLYDIGFDQPETHVIGRDQTMYYGFYGKHRKDQWNSVASKTANTACMTTSTASVLGLFPATRPGCRLSLLGICSWRCVRSNGEHP